MYARGGYENGQLYVWLSRVVLAKLGWGGGRTRDFQRSWASEERGVMKIQREETVNKEMRATTHEYDQ